MSTYLQRYLNGDHQAVCEDLMKRDSALAQTEYKDAMAVCSEIISRVKTNLSLLYNRLTILGYQFANPEKSLIFVEDMGDGSNPVHECGDIFDSLPLILRVWYTEIFSVDFSQDASQLFWDTNSPPNPIAGLGFNCPLIIVDPLTAIEIQKQLISSCSDSSEIERLSKFYPLGGWASNCDPVGVSLPSPGFDSEIYNEGFGSVSFTHHLRQIFRAGGFPFWENYFVNRHKYRVIPVVPDFPQIAMCLKDNLLNI